MTVELTEAEAQFIADVLEGAPNNDLLNGMAAADANFKRGQAFEAIRRAIDSAPAAEAPVFSITRTRCYCCGHADPGHYPTCTAP